MNQAITSDDVLSIAKAAASKVGRSPVDQIVMPCSRVNIGVFFDGTGCNRNLVGTGSITNHHSNPDYLESMYRDGEAVVDGCNVKFGHEYVPGIGTTGSAAQNLKGQSTGTGLTGVNETVLRSIEAIKSKIRALSGGKTQVEIVLDVFGYSRGAAAARFFVNRITQSGDLDIGLGTVRIRFMGLFDTVGSIGIPGDFDEGDVDISTNANRADYLVHITAEDEFRANFPLTLARFGQRIRMVGTHSDIGGGTSPSPTITTHTVSSQAVQDIIEEKWLTSEEKLTPISQGAYSRKEGYAPTISGHYVANAQPGLSMVALSVMYELAKQAGVPFGPFQQVVPSDLIPLRDALITNNSLPNHEIERIRKTYAHYSSDITGFLGGVGMGSEVDGIRRELFK